MTRHLGLVWELHAPTYLRLGIYVSSIGGLQPISRDTDNNIAMSVQLLVDEQKELIRNLLFSSTNMAAMT